MHTPERKLLLIAGALLVFILIGTRSAWGSPEWDLTALGSRKLGLTYRFGCPNWGGLKIETDSGLGGEMLFSYSYTTQEDGGYESSAIGFNPSFTYRLRGPSNTSPYVGLGYHLWREESENFVEVTYERSGLTLLAGIEHFFNENFSCDVRITAYLESWKVTSDGSEADGGYSEVCVGLGLSIFL